MSDDRIQSSLTASAPSLPIAETATNQGDFAQAAATQGTTAPNEIWQRIASRSDRPSRMALAWTCKTALFAIQPQLERDLVLRRIAAIRFGINQPTAGAQLRQLVLKDIAALPCVLRSAPLVQIAAKIAYLPVAEQTDMANLVLDRMLDLPADEQRTSLEQLSEIVAGGVLPHYGHASMAMEPALPIMRRLIQIMPTLDNNAQYVIAHRLHSANRNTPKENLAGLANRNLVLSDSLVDGRKSHPLCWAIRNLHRTPDDELSDVVTHALASLQALSVPDQISGLNAFGSAYDDMRNGNGAMVAPLQGARATLADVTRIVLADSTLSSHNEFMLQYALSSIVR